MHAQCELIATTEEVLPVGRTRIGVHLETNRGETIGFKTKRKPTAACKKVQSKRCAVWLWP